MPRFTDMLKTPKIINQDGKRYEFTPGESGSLIVRGNKAPMTPGLQDSRPKTGKVIAPMNEKVVAVGSSRG